MEKNISKFIVVKMEKYLSLFLETQLQ